MKCQGTLIANGTPDQRIVFTKADLALGNIPVFQYNYNSNMLRYGEIHDLSLQILGNVENCIIRNNRLGNFSSIAIHCVFTGNNISNISHGLLGYDNIINNYVITDMSYKGTHIWNVSNQAGIHETFETKDDAIKLCESINTQIHNLLKD